MKNLNLNYLLEKQRCNVFMGKKFPLVKGVDDLKVSSEYYFYLCFLSLFLIEICIDDFNFESAERIIFNLKSKTIID